VSKSFEEKLNSLGKNREPFLFLIDFELLRPMVWKTSEIPPYIRFSLSHSRKNSSDSKPSTERLNLEFKALDYKLVERRIKEVQKRQNNGESYLLNLSFKVPIHPSFPDLESLYSVSFAEYKFLWAEKFVCFSPECFIQIINNKLSTFPIKGTIDKSIPNAQMLLENDKKEIEEHNTVVDLLRNDLNGVSTNVRVEKFRVLSEINNSSGGLLQTNSEITGTLAENWEERIGSIIMNLLPAGSISGAPKRKTLSIIREVEQIRRNYYTGIFGYFDGNSLDSGILIRFIEKSKDKFYFRTGCGITINSIIEDEYNELHKKIYVPF
jgi:para-aminobenzoate synthetase component I